MTVSTYITMKDILNNLDDFTWIKSKNYLSFFFFLFYEVLLAGRSPQFGLASAFKGALASEFDPLQFELPPKSPSLNL